MKNNIIKFKKPVFLSLITHSHEQECCEWVYADWEYLRDTTFNYDKKIIGFIKVEDEGIRLVDEDNIEHFVPCYNSQNGYYSNDLSLVVEYDDDEKDIYDITECAKYDID